MRCHHWELSKVAPAAGMLTGRLQELPRGDALLVLSKAALPPDWEHEHSCKLLNGPSRFIRAYFSTPPAPRNLQHQRQLQSDWLLEFKRLRQASRSGDTCQAECHDLERRIHETLDWEERVIYPALNHFLGFDRPTRERRYEHDGIRKFLPRLKDALLSDAGWERFSLDLIHLLEHHLEHEDQGLFPVYERILQAGLGVSQVQ